MGYSNLFLHNVLNFTVKLFLILKIKKSLVSWGEKNWRTFFCFSVFYDHKKDQPHDSFRKSHKSVLSDIFHLVTEQRLQKFSLCKHTHPGKFTYQRCFVRDNSHRGQTQSIAKLWPCSLHYPQPNGQIRALLQVPLVRRLIAAEAALGAIFAGESLVLSLFYDENEESGGNPRIRMFGWLGSVPPRTCSHRGKLL